MKIFHDESKWGIEKVNFVDENNVLVGYELSCSCCEQPGWFISDVIEDLSEDREQAKQIFEPEEMPDLEGWVFDPEFFEKKEICNEWEGGSIAIFRIMKDDEEKFIHLYNVQNGYYGHGFEFKIGEEVRKEGNL